MSVEASVNQHEGGLWSGGNRPMGASYGKLMMWFFLLTDALTFSGFLTAYGLARYKFEDTWPIAEDVFTHFPFLHGDHPLLYVALMTFILIMSSVTMVLAVNYGHQMNQKKVALWLGLTILGGAAFVGSQAWEWYHFIHGTEEGAYVVDNRTYLNDGRTLEAGAVLQIMDDGSLRHPVRIGDREYTYITGAEAAELKEAARHIHGATMEENEYGQKQFANFFFFITGFHGFHVFSGVIINLVIFIGVVKGIYQKRGHYEMVEKVGLYWHFVDLVWVFVFTFFYLV